jgi:hypothetical protein
MGTRSLTHIKDEGLDSKTLVTFYRQLDGYPTGMGQDLKDFLKGIQICNGYSEDQEAGKWANGSGCLAAQLIKHMKDGIGSIYIQFPDAIDCGEEYVYTIYFVEADNDCKIYLRCADVCGDETVIFDGPINEWEIKDDA